MDGPAKLVALMGQHVLVELVVLPFELVVVEVVGQELLPLVFVPVEGTPELSFSWDAAQSLLPMHSFQQ